MANDLRVPRCFADLVDDAAMFPPGNAPLAVSIREHASHQASAYASMVGPLLVRDVHVTGLIDLAEEPLEIGVIGTTGPLGLERAIASLHDFPHIRVVAFEVPLPSSDLVPAAKTLVAALEGSNGITVSVELPRAQAGPDAEWIKAADVVTGAGFQAKFRTGGTEASAYPTEQELAAVLGALSLRPFKLTAGLHRAVRNTQPGTGFEQHGFLNIMVAVHRLLSGATVEDVVPILQSRDGAALAAFIGSWGDADLAAVRRVFRGFGCCGVTEPYEDLVDLGVIA